MPSLDVHRHVAALAPETIALRRELHRHPELAFEETWTASTLAARMRAAGLPVYEGIGGTGVLAVLEGATSGPTLLMRADIDALPIADATGREYASGIPGRNHACGHDAHAAMLVAVAQVLTYRRERIAGRVAFVFQPADEPMLGAKRMIEEGLLDRLAPEMSLGVHVLPMASVGQAVVQRGPIWASRDELTLRMTDRSTRSDVTALPDFARTAAELTSALYDLVEKETRATRDVTFRVRSIEAARTGPVWLGGHGDGRNHAAVEINLALYDNAFRVRLLERIAAVSRSIVAAAGGTLDIDVRYALPALVNDDRVTGAVERAAHRVIGEANVLTGWRHPFSDDFGLFMAAAPGALVLLGTANADKGIAEIWHRPGFDIDEDALPIGVEIMSLAALDLLSADRAVSPSRFDPTRA